MNLYNAQKSSEVMALHTFFVDAENQNVFLFVYHSLLRNGSL